MKKRVSYELILIVGSAGLPFLVKICALMFGATGYLLQSLYKFFQLLFPCLWRYRNGARGIRVAWPIDESLPSWRMCGIATLLALAFSIVVITALKFLIPFWQLDPATIREGYDARFAVGPLGALAVALFLSFANSALEELHFRVWLDKELSRMAGDRVGIGVSAVAFGCMHGLIFLGLPGFPLSLLAPAVMLLVIAGVSWSLLMRRPGGIHAAWWSHGLTNAILLIWGLRWLGYV